ncbi:MAG: AAA family ATPase [Thermoplasmataceae archaeon]
MRIKSLEIRMIRSHVQTRLEFTDGVTLIEGDVGSGKSTILMALEFAIFGFSGEKSNEILRLGEDRGFVELTFDMDGIEYKVARSIIRKGNVIEQKGLSLSYGGKEIRLSATELKRELLKILGYRDIASANSRNWIYRSAIFTPQESMKEVLSMDSKSRMATLRKILGIDDYSRAAANAQIVKRKLENEISRLEGMTSSVDQISRNLEEEKEKAVGLRSGITEAEKLVEAAKQEISGHDSVIDTLRKNMERFIQIKNEVNLHEKNVSRFREIIKSEETSVSRKTADLRKAKEKLEIMTGLKRPTDLDMDQIKARIKGLTETRSRLNTELGNVKEKVRDYTIAIEQGKCPFCDRPVTGENFGPHLKEREKKLESLSSRISEVDGELLAMEKTEKDLYTYLQATAGMSQLRESISSLEEDISDSARKKQAMENELKEISTKLEESRSKLSGHDRLETELREAEQKRRVLQTNLQNAIARSSDLKGKLSQSESYVKRYSEELGKLREIGKKILVIREYHAWIDTFLIRAFTEMEREVIAHERADFQNYFSQWFSKLVNDVELNASVDESFAPVINYGHFSQEISSLSGGEKTSVAIAYRLSLNTMIQAIAGGSADLLILDEPTDGFSMEQVGRMGEILRELGLRQILIVSHEAQVESFADHIIRVEKEDGVSRIVS